MNIYQILKWFLIIIAGILSIIYLGHLIMILLASSIFFSMLIPLKKFIQSQFKIKSDTLSSLLTLLFPSILLVLILLYIFPVIITQLNSLSYLNYIDVLNNILIQFPALDNLISHIGGKQNVLKSFEDAISQLININIITQLSAHLLNNFSQILINLLITFFITFHLLRDEMLPNHIFKQFISKNSEKDINEILMHIKEILGKYFRGLLIDVLVVMITNALILSLLGIKNAILIGILSGILNIIPYIGPLITLTIALFLGVSSNIIDNQYEWIGNTIIKIVLTLVSVNIIDGTVLQPFIFSNVLKAHPLEIFLVIIAAGMIGGILWMMLIIPIYVIIKVVFKEFNKYWKTKSNA